MKTNIFKNKNFRNFIIKTTAFLAIGMAVQFFIGIFFRNTYLFKTYLTIPKAFSLEAPNIRNILINALLFGLITFIIISYEKLLKIKSFKFKKHQIFFAILAIAFVISQYVLKYLINQNTTYFLQAVTFWGIIKILIIALFVISLTLAVFGLDFFKYFIKEYKKEIGMFILLSAAFFTLMLLVQNLWTYFSSFISNLLYHIFSLFFQDVTYKPFVSSFTMSEGGGPLLGIGNFKAIVGKPCSGIDSFLLFTSLYSLIFILDYKKLKKGLAITLFFVGAIGMFLTNLIRILLLFIVGAYIDANFAIGMFHSNIGWILFIIYFFIFWWIASKYVYKEK
jgi:exosortase/archaeosortase family protein